MVDSCPRFPLMEKGVWLCYHCFYNYSGDCCYDVWRGEKQKRINFEQRMREIKSKEDREREAEEFFKREMKRISRKGKKKVKRVKK